MKYKRLSLLNSILFINRLEYWFGSCFAYNMYLLICIVANVTGSVVLVFDNIRIRIAMVVL